MRQPLARSTKAIRKMSGKQFSQHINQYFSDSEYKGKALQDFNKWETCKIKKWLKNKEKEYAEAKINNTETDFIKSEIVHCKQIIAERQAKFNW